MCDFIFIVCRMHYAGNKLPLVRVSDTDWLSFWQKTDMLPNIVHSVSISRCIHQERSGTQKCKQCFEYYSVPNGCYISLCLLLLARTPSK